MKKLLSIIASIVMAITSVSLTAFTASADDSLDYNSTITTKILFKFIIDNLGNNFYFVIDSYKDYTACGLNEKSEEFFNDNILLVNCIYNPMTANDVYTNKSVVKEADNTLSISYDALWEFPRGNEVNYATDIIELKKTDVKDIDFSKLTVNVRNEYIASDPAYDPTPSSNDVELKMNYIDISSLIDDTTSNTEPSNTSETSTTATPTTQAPITTPKATTPTTPTKVTKPAKVAKLKATAKKKKLNVSWKKVSGATGYEVLAATNNKFTKNKKTVDVKKNKAVIKKLKAKKKYFVKVRAYKTVNGTKYYGKWSKVVKKKTK